MNDVERNLLSICLRADGVHDAISAVSEEDFLTELGRQTFSAIKRLADKGAIPDSRTLIAEDPKLPISFLLELEEYMPNNSAYHIDRFVDHAEKNRYVNLGKKLSSMPEASKEEMRSEIDNAVSFTRGNGSIHIADAVKNSLAKMETAFQNMGAVSGLPTGIDRLDNELSGLHNTDMVLVAARPSIGKTAFAAQIAEQAAVDKRAKVLFINLEMSADQLASRMMLSRARINVSKARNGLFENSEWPKITLSSAELADANLWIDDCAGADIDTIISKAKAAKIRHGIDLLVIDYLGLISGKGTEYERVTEASRKTKILAQQINIPIVALHQLNRSNLDNRPTMNELRSSGQLEQDADVIILLHRKKEEDVERCEVIVEKNRHGRTGIIDQTWNGPINRFESPKY